MPPKKRERDGDSSKNPQNDQYQADHELFLNAFEKPTQIYRFLRTRNMTSPIFLNRTLTYMKQRMSRNHKTRRGFKVNILLERIRERCQANQFESVKGFMTLTFLGFYDKNISSQELVKVETSVTKISHKKRKDSSSPLVKLFAGISEVPVNPSEEQPPSKAPIISIPSESFNMSNGNVIKSYVLFLRVIRTISESNEHNISVNGNLDGLEPVSKKPKTGREESYGSELTVYDKHNRCLMMSGDYELGLQEMHAGTKYSPKKSTQWVTMEHTEDEAFETLRKGPMIKFRLDWTSEPSSGWVDRPRPYRPNSQTLDMVGNKENRPEKSAVAVTNKSNKTTKAETQRQQIVYQFLYNNNSRQQTEACDDLICPWCSLNCVSLYSLLKHLKLCHSRFTFTYNQIPQGARIDVAINECYDGSYTGSPHDLISQPPGFAFSRNGPVRRTSVTNILVCRPKRPRPSLSEFLELEENDFDGQRPFITGHNRLYHHTTTCLPVYPKEMDIDSEGENDPKWLQQKTMMMIDDFTDVNEGEKELMKLWNLHVMKHGYVGDCQIPLACLMFLKAKGEELLSKNLYRNFLLHVCNLFDFGLLSSATLYMIVRQVQELVKKDPQSMKLLLDTWTTQRENWLVSGGQGGSQDKTGVKFMFYTPKQEPNNPKLTSSSTFISGDGTLRRKMTQQTPNKASKQLKAEKDAERRKMESSSNGSVATSDKRKSQEDEGRVEGDTKRKPCDASDASARKKTQNSPKRKLSVQAMSTQDIDKSNEVAIRRKSTSCAEQPSGPLVQFRRKSTACSTSTPETIHLS